jgi:hypothetical protein
MAPPAARYEVPLASGGLVVVEADQAFPPGRDSGTTLASPTLSGSIGKATRNLRDLTADLKPMIEDFKAGLGGLASGDVEIEFGLRFSAETGFVVAKGTAEVNFTVRVAWKNE